MNRKALFLPLIAALLVAGLSASAQVLPDAKWSSPTTVISAVGSTTTGTYPASTGMTTNSWTAIAIHIVSASTSSATVIAQQNVTGAFWYPSFTVTNPTSSGELWLCPASGNLRLNLSVHGSGTISAFVRGRSMQGDPITECHKIDQAATVPTGANTWTSDQTFSAAIKGNQTVKALTAASATTFAKLTVASGAQTSGFLSYAIEADDGTDYQTRSGVIPFTAVNKAGTITCTVGTVAASTEVAALSSGTLTNTFTCADAGSGVLDLKANAVSSLTETTLQIRYRVNALGTPTITPQ